MLPSEYLQLGWTKKTNAVDGRDIRVSPDSPAAEAWSLYGAIGVAQSNRDISHDTEMMFYALLYKETDNAPIQWNEKCADQATAVALMQGLEEYVFALDPDLEQATIKFRNMVTICEGCYREAPRYLTTWCHPFELCFVCMRFTPAATDEAVEELEQWRETEGGDMLGH